MTEKTQSATTVFRTVKWYCYIFSLMFLFYGGVTIILDFLDHKYDNLAGPFIFLLVGVILINICFAYRDKRRWGWYGLVVVNGLVVLLSLFGLGNIMNIVLLVLSAVMLALLFLPQTKAEIFSR